MELLRQKITITLLLKGGYQRCLKLDATDPSLISLLEVVAKVGDERTRPTVFNLEMEDGEGSLYFAASDLIALSTKPSISIDLQVKHTEIEASHLVKENYLSEASMAKLLTFVGKHAAEFRSSKSAGRKRSLSERKSLSVLTELGDFEEMFRERVRVDLPEVLAKLRIPEFPISEIGCQILSYNDNHHLGRHRDKGPPPGTSRIVTFGYYFHREPRRFEGGSLRLYKGILKDGNYSAGRAAVDLNPANNTMIFFPSACFHEVLPVKCASGQFCDGRFTVNGWVHKANRAQAMKTSR
jgi:Rps23 Pro-64 3,4-dihydroxylase Tpa1-like proline 4-hydroxylase